MTRAAIVTVALLLAACAPTTTTVIHVPPPTVGTPTDLPTLALRLQAAGTPVPIASLAAVYQNCAAANAVTELIFVIDNPDTPGVEYDKAASACSTIWEHWTALLTALGWTSVPGIAVPVGSMSLSDFFWLGVIRPEDVTSPSKRTANGDIAYDPTTDTLLKSGPGGIGRYEIVDPVATHVFADVPVARKLDGMLNGGTQVRAATGIPASSYRMAGWALHPAKPNRLWVMGYEDYNVAANSYKSLVAMNIGGGLASATVEGGGYALGGLHSTGTFSANAGSAAFYLPTSVAQAWFGAPNVMVTAGHRKGHYAFGSGDGPGMVAWVVPDALPSGGDIGPGIQLLYYGKPDWFPDYRYANSYEIEFAWSEKHGTSGFIVFGTQGTMTIQEAQALWASHGNDGAYHANAGPDPGSGNWYGPGICQSAKGWWCFDLFPKMWLIPTGQIESVLAGADPGSPRPTEERDLSAEFFNTAANGANPTCSWRFDGGAAWDPGREWMYVMEEAGLVHVFAYRPTTEEPTP